jgi:anti-sigma regulatory factor (Ser/Thr protein kinase)
MFSQSFNWRSLLVFLGIAIASGTIFYSNYLAKKIAADERKKVNVWIQSLKTRAEVTEQSALDLTNIITNENTDIPIIETDEKDIPSGQGLNLDSNRIKTDPDYLNRMVKQFRRENEPLIIEISKDPLIRNKYYYGDSQLLKEVKYYPLIQLFIVALFVIGLIILIALRNKSTQNQVWAGMAKETAHQLGTPISSLEGWIEMLKESGQNEKIAGEMEKDVRRLKLVSDRFGKIGSAPQLELANLVKQVEDMLAYIRKRAPSKVNFHLEAEGKTDIPVMMNTPLFDWVMENLLKNALDALEGHGDINLHIRDAADRVIIDVSDTGKGIAKKHIPLVFKPGFSTKKRGWGLGLSLSKRIMEHYHRGELFVKQSEAGKGTTFRIILRKEVLST